MKLHELNEDTLEEGRLKRAAATAAIVASAFTASQLSDHPDLRQKVTKVSIDSAEATARKLVSTIVDTYNVSDHVAKKIVDLAYKYEDPVFPKAQDILAVIAVESSFNPHAKSGLRNDPAVGLMQVRPGIWGMDGKKLANSMEEQVKTGSEILSTYFKKLGTKDAAFHAFNIGITNFKNHRGLNPAYAKKVHAERKRLINGDKNVT